MVGDDKDSQQQQQQQQASSSSSSRSSGKGARMRLQKNKGRGGSSSVEQNNGNEADLLVSITPNNDEEEDSSASDLEDLSQVGSPNNSVTSALVRKVRRRAGLSATDQEVVRLIGQHLHNIGLGTSASVLMQEAGCRLDQPTAATFRKLVMSGEWSHAVKTLEELKNHLENPESMVEMKFLLLEQKYLELLSRGNSIDALKVLQTELTPLKHNQSRTHELSSYLMFSSPEDIARVTRSGGPVGSTASGGGSSSNSGPSSPALSNGVVIPAASVAPSEGQSRRELMDRLQAYLPAAIMLPPRRLLTLLNQAAEFQTERCLYHNRGGALANAPLDSTYLAVDHQCSKQDFPCETIQVLTDHCEEVWYCRFSPDGLKLATGGKDNTVIIWEFDPDTLALKHNKTLERHNHGVAFFAWSPDSARLAVCGPEDCDEVCIWNVDSGTLECKIAHSSEDSLTTVSWSPDGRKIACGGSRGQFYQCDTKGTVLDSWEGVRVQALAYRRDGKSVLAADTHHRIRAYNFEELTDYSVLQEDNGIMTFTLDDADRLALLNIATQGIHLWNVEERCLVRKFVGITQGFYTIYSCFGGTDGNFVASGSEDNKVYIYHIKKETPIAVLSGHTRTVNCVAWNPVYPRVMVSGSDDSTVRVWGPSEKYRKQHIKAAATAAAAAAANASKNEAVPNGDATPTTSYDYCGNGVG